MEYKISLRAYTIEINEQFNIRKTTAEYFNICVEKQIHFCEGNKYESDNNHH